MDLSVSKKVWHLQSIEPELLVDLMRKHNIPELLARILINRKVALNEFENFLNPSLKKQIPNPEILLDMKKAITRTYQAIKNQEKICIYSDYDVDGATSSAILRRYFKAIGIETGLYIPDRIKEGYGPNSQALLKLKDEDFKLVLMTDCGTTSFEPLDTATKNGLDVIILDHHISKQELPNAFAIINPNRFDQDCGDRQDLKNLCSAGLAFLYLVSLHKTLRDDNFFKNIQEPDLRQFLDLVALGTICDVMQLTNLNRTLVSKGLQVMGKFTNNGIKIMYNILELKEKPNVYHMGFIIGPRINAGGRVGQANLGSILLTTEDKDQAQEIVYKINQYNADRQFIEAQILKQAEEQIANQNLYEKNFIVVFGDEWHSGVIGVVCGKLKEKYSRPVIVIGFEGDIGKGSGRSIPNFNLGNFILKAVEEDILINGGGHSMAAGLTISKNQIDRFLEYLDKNFKIDKEVPVIMADGYISVSSINKDFWNKISMLEPYGQGNPMPKFIMQNLQVTYSDIVGDKHIRCNLQDEHGKKIPAIAFNSVSSPLEAILLNYPSNRLDFIGTIRLENWQNREQFKFYIEDVKTNDS